MSKRVSFGPAKSSGRKNIPAAANKAGSQLRRSKRLSSVSTLMYYLTANFTSDWPVGCCVSEWFAMCRMLAHLNSAPTLMNPSNSYSKGGQRSVATELSLYETLVTNSSISNFDTLPMQGVSTAVVEGSQSRISSRSSEKSAYKEIPDTNESKQINTKRNSNRPSGKYLPVVIIKSLPWAHWQISSSTEKTELKCPHLFVLILKLCMLMRWCCIWVFFQAFCLDRSGARKFRRPSDRS